MLLSYCTSLVPHRCSCIILITVGEKIASLQILFIIQNNCNFFNLLETVPLDTQRKRMQVYSYTTIRHNALLSNEFLWYLAVTSSAAKYSRWRRIISWELICLTSGGADPNYQTVIVGPAGSQMVITGRENQWLGRIFQPRD